MPLLMAGIVAYVVAKKHLKWPGSSLTGLVSVYLSTIVGIIVYGISVGWQYVTNDAVSQAVFMATAGMQTITYIVGLGLFALVVKRYNKAIKRDAA